MPKRSSKKPTDINQLARHVVDLTTGENNKSERKKNPAAVELGRLGGKRGGPARAKKLSAKKRLEIAKRAAAARWARRHQP